MRFGGSIAAAFVPLPCSVQVLLPACALALAQEISRWGLLMQVRQRALMHRTLLCVLHDRWVVIARLVDAS